MRQKWGTNKIWSQMKIICSKFAEIARKSVNIFVLNFYPPPLNVGQQMKIKNKLFQIAQNGEKICKTYFFVTPQLQQQLIQPLSLSM